MAGKKVPTGLTRSKKPSVKATAGRNLDTFHKIPANASGPLARSQTPVPSGKGPSAQRGSGETKLGESASSVYRKHVVKHPGRA